MIFGKALPGIILQLSSLRYIIKKSVFQMSGKNAVCRMREKRLFFYIQGGNET